MSTFTKSQYLPFPLQNITVIQPLYYKSVIYRICESLPAVRLALAAALAVIGMVVVEYTLNIIMGRTYNEQQLNS